MSEKGSSSSCPVSPAVGTVSGGVGHPLLAGPGPSCPLRNSEPEPSQLPHPTQRLPLSRDRLVSSIPKTEAHTPQHQPVDAPNWTYPSEQMFYNALKRKGYDARDEDIPAVVAIHNAVNERAWAKVKSWEAMHEERCAHPRLLRFRGRPMDLSPKARFKTFLGYTAPFDRHDWVVDRCGQEVRYVIDFYNASSTRDKPIAMHLDVRPALDSVGAALDRVKRFWGWQ